MPIRIKGKTDKYPKRHIKMGYRDIRFPVPDALRDIIREHVKAMVLEYETELVKSPVSHENLYSG